MPEPVAEANDSDDMVTLAKKGSANTKYVLKFIVQWQSTSF
jgi:hypothetical protein